VLVVTLLATVSFDGFLHTPVWAGFYAASSHALYDIGWTGFLGNTGARTLVFTVGLLLAPACFVALFLGTCGLMARLENLWRGTRRGVLDVACEYVLTLVPIAIAYHLAHYLLLLIVEGQLLYGHISDPFGVGWDLFGTAGVTPDPTVVDARLLWLFSLFVIVAGHVIAVWLAHRAARRASGGETAVAPQIPMLVLMVGYTIFSLWIIGQPIVEV
ncbi:MAG: fenitrothion hydrolase, partial [Deltaproteobacteria bacterium]|nr:fenitrothion hydrolase [Deltaproteobacteria bacterium]